MIKISKQNNSLIVEGIDNVFYINNGDNSYPLNSLIVVTDKSDMATFRSVATNDVLFSGLIQNITINGEAVTKENIIEKFDAVSNSSTGGGTVDAYTKEEADTKFASKDELTAVETAMDGKQATLVSGENIKTINSQSILGSGDLTVSGVSEEQAQEIAKIPTLETEIAQKANASDVPTVQTGEVGTDKNYVYSDGDVYNSNYRAVMSKLGVGYNGKEDVILTYHLWNSPATNAVALPKATTSKAGIITAADKTKLDSIPENIPTQTEVDNIAANVSALQTDMMGKQDTLVSGTNIKTINGNSILGEGNLVIEGGGTDLSNYYNKTEVDTKLDAKQNTLVSGTNIKTINGVSVLGEGNIEVSGGIKTYEASEVPSVLLEQFRNAVRDASSKKYYDKYTTTDVTPISQFLSNLSNGDYLKLYDNNAYKLQFIGNRKVGNDFDYYFNIIVSSPGETNIYSNYITVTVLSSQIYVGNNKSVKVAKITDIPNTDNFATKDELTAVETSLSNKQDILVSGTNIKTINSQSILGEGNLEVTIPDATTATSGAMSAADKTKLDSISNEWTGTQQEYDALTTKDNNTIYYVTE